MGRASSAVARSGAPLDEDGDAVEHAIEPERELIGRFLPYVSSGFVPTDTMPAVLHAFAEHQPITPIVETLRGLIMGTSTGGNGRVAIAWCVAILAAGYLGSASLFRRRRAAH